MLLDIVLRSSTVLRKKKLKVVRKLNFFVFFVQFHLKFLATIIFGTHSPLKNNYLKMFVPKSFYARFPKEMAYWRFSIPILKFFLIFAMKVIEKRIKAMIFASLIIRYIIVKIVFENLAYKN